MVSNILYYALCVAVFNPRTIASEEEAREHVTQEKI